MSLSAAILVATCTATFGLHSSSSTTSSYSYFALASALRSFTARSAELRPPMPLTETPPVNGPMKPTFTLSLASAVAAMKARIAAVSPIAVVLPILIISASRYVHIAAPIVALMPSSRGTSPRASQHKLALLGNCLHQPELHWPSQSARRPRH